MDGQGDVQAPGPLAREYDLAGERSLEPHYYHVQSELAIYSGKGVVKSTDVFREHLMCEPGDRSAGEADRFTCARASMKRGDGAEVTIPALEGFSYTVDKQRLDKNSYDEQGQLYGIPEVKFKGLTDSAGSKLPFDVAYQVYSLFFYYHSYVDYAEPSPEGKGVQHLKRVGDKIVHYSAFAESPLPGSLAGKGSVWRNGETTIEFKGLGVVGDALCAIIGLDSGLCAWFMPLTVMRIMGLKVIGVSNYHADIYLDLKSRWVRKLELVLSETTVVKMWGVVPVDRSFPRTTLTIRAVSKDEFDRA